MDQSIGFLQLGMSYAQSADLLAGAVCSESVRLSHKHPIDFLYAHALELMLKGCLIVHDPTADVQSYRHDLLRLYDEVKSGQLLNNLIGSVERAHKEHWRRYLRDARDKHRRKLEAALGPELLSAGEFGVVDNNIIGSELPDLKKQIVWLDARHKESGSEFRYLRRGLDHRDYITAFGLSINVVWQSSQWACQEIYDHFREQRSATMP